MEIQLQLMIKRGDGTSQRIETITELRRGDLSLQTLGLTLAESKNILEKIQGVMVDEQAQAHLQKTQACEKCSTPRPIKGGHDLVFRTVFGKCTMESPRWYDCRCASGKRRSHSPLALLLPERTTPELLYLETKYASLMSYGLSVDILGELLPIGKNLNGATVRRHQQEVAERIEKELGEEQGSFVEGCPRDWGALPRPEAPLVVGIDGGYVHAREGDNRKAGWFEVIVGKSGSEKRPDKCFGFVNIYDKKPRRRIFEVLNSQGMQNNQQVTFMSDGGDTVRDLQFYLNPESEHILDWFHVTMRLTVMRQMVKGLPKDEAPAIDAELERVKWYLWHGNTHKAVEILEEMDCWTIEELVERVSSAKPLLKALREFHTYIRNNINFIPNYGDRYRHGEAISTAFVESTVNQVISRRFVKKQQMRWTQRGAHLLLQTRTKVLNEELHDKFREWYPNMSEKEAA